MREFVKLGNFIVKDEEARKNKGTKLYLHNITFKETMVSLNETADGIMIISTVSTPYKNLWGEEFMNGSIVQFLISTHNDAGVMTWGTLRTIGGTVLQLHTLSNTTVASITFPQINNGLVDTVTEL